MKTNQMMKVSIGGFMLPIGHKTQMGSLNALWSYGNGLRKAKGLSVNYSWITILRSPETLEFLLAVEKRYGTGISKYVDSTELENSINTDDYEILPKQGLTIEYDRKTGRAKIIGGELSIIKTKRGKYGAVGLNCESQDKRPELPKGIWLNFYAKSCVKIVRHV